MVQIYTHCGTLGNGAYSFAVDEVQNKQKFTSVNPQLLKVVG